MDQNGCMKGGADRVYRLYQLR